MLMLYDAIYDDAFVVASVGDARKILGGAFIIPNPYGYRVNPSLRMNTGCGLDFTTMLWLGVRV